MRQAIVAFIVAACLPAFNVAAQIQTAHFDFNGIYEGDPGPNPTYAEEGPGGGSFVGIVVDSRTGTGTGNHALTVNGSSNGVSFVLTPVGGDALPFNPVVTDLASDYAFTETSASFTISGILGPTADLWFHSGQPGLGVPSLQAKVSIPGQSPDPHPLGTDPAYQYSQYFADVPVTGGTIVATFGDGAVSTMGGFSVISVPEPASILSLAAAAGASLLRRRQRA